MAHTENTENTENSNLIDVFNLELKSGRLLKSGDKCQNRLSATKYIAIYLNKETNEVHCYNSDNECTIYHKNMLE